MLTRRHIRIKVMQGLYSLHHSPQTPVTEQWVFVQKSMNQMNALYLSMLSLFIELQQYAEEQCAHSEKKYIKGDPSPFPNPNKWAQNALLLRLKNDGPLREALAAKKMNIWYLHPEYVKIIHQDIVASKWYQNYMLSDQEGWVIDQKVLIALFKEVIAPNERLYDLLEDDQITWVDDIPTVNTYLLKELKKWTAQSSGTALPDWKIAEDDLIFARELLQKTHENNQLLEDEFIAKTPQWDKERIAEVDALLLKMAICELLFFSEIPERVTLNEYLEIAKEYSSPKSSIFINGILDVLTKEFVASQRLQKKGRGLL